MEPTKEDRFKPGDVVRTKFGGPRMTIAWRMASRIGGEVIPDRYFCQWFIGKELHEGNFPGVSLELDDDDDSDA